MRVRTRLANPDALLSRTDLRELGLERRAVDAVFRALPVIVLPGYRRPLVRVSAYLELLERSTYDLRRRPRALKPERLVVGSAPVPRGYPGRTRIRATRQQKALHAGDCR